MVVGLVGCFQQAAGPLMFTENLVHLCLRIYLSLLRDGFASRDSSKLSSGLSEPTKLIAVRVLTP